MWHETVNFSQNIISIMAWYHDDSLAIKVVHLVVNVTLFMTVFKNNIWLYVYHDLHFVCRYTTYMLHKCIHHKWNHSWWRHQMETFSALLAICAGNSPVPGEFPTQRPVTQSFHVFFDMHMNKRLRKQSRGWWFETQSRSLWRHCNVNNVHG